MLKAVWSRPHRKLRWKRNVDHLRVIPLGQGMAVERREDCPGTLGIRLELPQTSETGMFQL